VTWQPSVFPMRDAVADLALWLRTVANYTLGQSSEGWESGPFVRLTRAGGRLEPPFDRIDVQFDCYGADADEALDVTAAIRSHLPVAPLHLTGCVEAVELSGPLWLPEGDDPAQPRFVMDWAFRFRSPPTPAP